MRRRLPFSQDEFAWQLADHLCEDFMPFLDDAWYSHYRAALLLRDLKTLRSISVGDMSNMSKYELKARIQLTKLFKKFTFSSDIMTREDVHEASVKKFMDNQARINAHVIDWSDPLIGDIRSRTRGHVDRILGYFSQLDVLERAKNGKKSSVGISMRNASEAARYEPPITGSGDHCVWFEKIFSSWNRPAFNYVSQLAVDREVPLTAPIDTLTATLVPKSFDSLRMIMPNTVIGQLWSSGLGKLIEEKLRAFGYDIRHLQGVHGQLARLGSITGSVVTADQRLASDNITVEHIAEFFPQPWADALSFGRIAKLKLDNHTIETKTFATMGIGFTFPMQTLLFLSLLLAIRDHLGLEESTVVSVFGDDLIYDAELHALVLEVFAKLGLAINEDKTFAEGYFRESCGQDFYHGFDVRPFHLGEDSVPSDSHPNFIEAYLYTTINGLRRRWLDEDIPVSLAWLLDEVCLRNDPKGYLLVPHDYPDTAGVKVSKAEFEDFPDGIKPRVDVHGTCRFRSLVFEPKQRKETRHAPYLWLNLRQGPVKDPRALAAITRIKGSQRSWGLLLEPSPSTFKENTEKDDKGRQVTFRSKISGRRLISTVTTIPLMDSGRYIERPGVTGHWAPEVVKTYQVNTPFA